MKKSSFLLLAILLWCSKSVLAQADFAPVGATWFYGFHRDGYPAYRIQKSVGDTVVAGQSCRRIDNMVVKHVNYVATAPVDTIYNEDAYYVYANSDTVFNYRHDLQKFVPLYIFNVNIGDTVTYDLPASFLPSNTFRVKVTSITTLMVDGHPLKTIHTQGIDGFNFSEGRYTERLGNLEGFDWLGPVTSDWFETRIRCYSDSVINYVRQQGVVCNSIPGETSIEEGRDYDGVNIYPNPATDHILIKTQNPQNEILQVMLLDIAGRKVFEQAEAAANVIINTNDFSSGTYLLHVKTKEGNAVRKINIQ